MTEDVHPKAGVEFSIVNERVITSILDHPAQAIIRGLTPDRVLAGWRITGDNEAKRRGGLIFCGETRSGQDITRHYCKWNWRRAVWFIIFKPQEYKLKW